MLEDDQATTKPAGGGKRHRSHGERALASMRGAKRLQREISDPADRIRILLAEANVLALLDLADAISPGTDEAARGD